MNREILFRGKRTDNGEWVYGYPVGWQNEGGDISIVDSRFGACIDESGNLMMLEAPFVTKVDPATVGQCTGLTDKNGKRIFEGDIVRNGYSSRLGEFWDAGNVVYVSTDGCFEICNVGEQYLKRLTRTQIVERSIEVIGTIFDEGETT